MKVRTYINNAGWGRVTGYIEGRSRYICRLIELYSNQVTQRRMVIDPISLTEKERK